MTRDDVLQDLAYARTLAEEGRTAPLLGGAYLCFWGVLNAIAGVTEWALLEDYLPNADGLAFAWLWGGYALAAFAGMSILRGRMRDKPGQTSIGAQAERALWSGVGIAISAVAIGSILRMFLDNDQSAPNFIFGAAFALYGAALFGVARLARQPWMQRFGWLSVAVALTLCVFANQSWAYLIVAGGSLLVLLWPGLILLKQEPSSIV